MEVYAALSSGVPNEIAADGRGALITQYARLTGDFHRGPDEMAGVALALRRA